VSTDVRSEISGKIDSILIQDGQMVKAGQKLIELDRTSLETDFREAQRNYMGRKLSVDKAQRDYERLLELYNNEFAQEREMLDAKTDLELAKIELEVRQARLDKATENLSKTTIIAPHDGIVANLDINEGQVIIGATSVNQGTSLMTIQNLDGLFVQTDINELDIEKINEGDRVRVSFDAIADQEFKGTVSQVFSYARNVNNQRVFRVRVIFDSAGKNIRPGISASLVFPVVSVEDVPALIISAVYLEDGKEYAYLITGKNDDGSNALERTPVETGAKDKQYVEIVSGLKLGDEVSLVRGNANPNAR